MGNVPERVKIKRMEWARNDAKRDAGLVEPADLEKYRSVSYGQYGDSNLLDVYVPKNKGINANPGSDKWPVIVSVHGGGFFYGDKELYRFYCMHLAEYGFAVVNFNYRLAPEFTFPSPLEDIMRVMDWVSKNADAYGLDVSNVFMVGDSAGAQLVSQFACIMSNGAYATLFGLKAPENIKLKAVSLACGTYSFPARIKGGRPDDVLKDYLGDMKLLEDPRTEVNANITAEYPPTYIFSAYNDFLYGQCEPMAQLIASRGVEVKSRIYGTPEAKEIAHVFHVDMRLSEGEKANKDQTDFFKAHIN